MREKLKPMENARSRFTGIFERYGRKPSYKGLPKVTLCFVNVKDQLGRMVTDHIWFTTTKGFEQFSFEKGDIVSFDARVRKYWKGYAGYREDVECSIQQDYRLSNPTNIHSTKAPQTNNPTLF